MPLLGIILVIGAYLILLLSGAVLVRNALGFGKTVKRVMSEMEPKTLHLISQAEAAQRRSFSIMEARDLLARKAQALRPSLMRLQILLSALGEAWRRVVTRVLAYVGM